MTSLYSFNGSDGAYPEAGVLIANSGALYGTTVQGGSGKRGTIYVLKLPTGSGGWTETVLYNLGGAGAPWTPSGLTPGHGGAMFVAATAGGSNGSGAVFKLKPPASPGDDWTEATLYSFTAAAGDGAAPNGGLVLIKSGVIYGTTKGGGTAGNGTVFSLSPPTAAGGSWTETVLYRFSSNNSGPYGPRAGVIAGKGGTLYGTTCCGGTANHGAIYKLSPPSAPGGSWTETTLYDFKGGPADGANPMAGLIMGKNGTLYGTTKSGGTKNVGTVFALAPPATQGGNWTETVLYSFLGGNDGSYPEAGLLKVASGALYGTTSRGGAAGLGTIFKLALSGGGWTETVVQIFGADNGAVPMAGLAQAGNGAIYGTTEFGGSAGDGTIFKLTP
jgi:uncharacterized repeat protein (TIGR03803 family)